MKLPKRVKKLLTKWHNKAQSLCVSVKEKCTLVKDNKVSTLQLSLLLWLVYRVECLNVKLDIIAQSLEQAFNTVMQIGSMLFVNIAAAAERFDDAIKSILALFGGDGA